MVAELLTVCLSLSHTPVYEVHHLLHEVGPQPELLVQPHADLHVGALQQSRQGVLGRVQPTN